MSMPIGKRNPYNILHVVFACFTPTILFLKGTTMEMQLHSSFFFTPAIAPYIEYIKIRVDNFHLIM